MAGADSRIRFNINYSIVFLLIDFDYNIISNGQPERRIRGLYSAGGVSSPKLSPDN